MTSSETTPPADSPSTNPPTPPPSPVTSSPLRVKTPATAGSPIPSPTSPAETGSPIGFDPVDTATGSTPSSDRRAGAAVKLDTKSLVEIARAAVLTASQYVHAALAKPDDEAEADLWIARDEDQAQIGDPLAKIAGRRGLAGQVSPDVANLIETGFGLLAYLAYHVGEQWSIRRARRRAAKQAGELTRTDNGQPA